MNYTFEHWHGIKRTEQFNTLWEIGMLLAQGEALRTVPMSEYHASQPQANFKSVRDRAKSVFFGGRAVRDPDVLKFLQSQTFDIYKININANMSKQLEETTLKWMKESPNINVNGLKDFQFLSMPGLNTVLKEFIMKNKNKRIRVMRGEYWYVITLLKESPVEWKYMDEDDIQANDCVIASVPFFSTMDIPDLSFLDVCDKLDVPVLIDLCWSAFHDNVTLDVNRKCIKIVTLSLCKNWPVETLRLGVRWCKEGWYYPSDKLYNQYRLNSELIIRLMVNFKANYIIKKYKSLQHKWNNRLGLQPTPLILTSRITPELQWFNQHRNLGVDWSQDNMMMAGLYENEDLINKYFNWN